MSRNVYVNIKKEYDRRQKLAMDELMARQEKVYEKFPQIEKIDGTIRYAGLKYNKALLAGSISPNDAYCSLKAEVEGLRKDRSAQLQLYGYSADYLDSVYTCAKCKDTGYISTDIEPGGLCSCHRQLIINNIYSQSNLMLTGAESFESFDESLYSDITDERRYGIRNSPRKQIIGIKENSISFIENFSSTNVKHLLFCGPTGVGKTFLAECIAAELMRKGITVLYQTAPVLFNSINEYRQKAFKYEACENEAYNNILNVDLLIIDDLGTESPSAARYAELLTILDTRSANNLRRPCKTIIATNIDLKKLFDYYDERIVSRIVGGFDIFRFAGDDIRKLKSTQ